MTLPTRVTLAHTRVIEALGYMLASWPKWYDRRGPRAHLTLSAIGRDVEHMRGRGQLGPPAPRHLPAGHVSRSGSTGADPLVVVVSRTG